MLDALAAAVRDTLALGVLRLWQWILDNRLWPPNDRAQWTVTAAAFVAATTLAVLTYRLHRAQSLPLLTMKREGGGVKVKNVGKGPALNTAFTDADGEVIEMLGTIAPDQEATLQTPRSFDFHDKYCLYYHRVQRGMLSRLRLWHRTLLHTHEMTGAATQVFVIDVTERVWLAPKAVRRYVSMETPWDYMRRRMRWWSVTNHARALALAVRRRWVRDRRRVRHWWERKVRERYRSTFEAYAGVLDRPDDVERAKWRFDVTGALHCPRHPYDILQLSCKPSVEGFIAAVQVRDPVGGPGHRAVIIPGIVVVHRRVLERLGVDRDVRNQELWTAVKEYFCHYRPDREFVCELRR